MRVHKHHIYVNKILYITYDRPYNEKIYYEHFRNLNKIIYEINWLSYQQSTFIFGLRTNHIYTIFTNLGTSTNAATFLMILPFNRGRHTRIMLSPSYKYVT